MKITDIPNVDLYVKYLVSKLGDANGRYFTIMTLLGIEFYSEIPSDSSRIVDGLELRESFLDYMRNTSDKDVTDISKALSIYPCSVLEVLMTLAMKVHEDLMYTEGDSNWSRWFWMYLDNLGIDDVTDTSWNPKSEFYIRTQVEKFLDKNYNADGSGGNIYVIYENPYFNIYKASLWNQSDWFYRMLMNENFMSCFDAPMGSSFEDILAKGEPNY